MRLPTYQTRDTPRPCQQCLFKQLVCQKDPGPSKCPKCKQRKVICNPSTDREVELERNCCRPCRRQPRSLTCERATPDAPCNHCIASNNQLNCIPKKSIVPSLIPREQRCYTCALMAGQYYKNKGISPNMCDSNDPCNVCT